MTVHRPDSSPLNRIASVVIAICLSTLTAVVAAAIWHSFTTYKGARATAIAVLLVGTMYGIGIGVVVLRAKQAVWGVITLVVAIVLVAAVPCSVAIGRVTHASVGFTVYGVVPIPMMDLSIGGDGMVRVRDKSHVVKAQEVETLRQDGADIVVIGTGWEGKVRVEEQLRNDKSVIVLPTGAAFKAYNRAKAAGQRVALLAHTTC